MKKSTVALFLSLACGTWAAGQDVQGRSSGSANSETVAKANADAITLESGTRLTAELQKTLDVRKASVGDEVVLKTTQAIKSDGRVVIEKGARVFGRVTEVAKNNKNGSSRIGILFNRLEKGPLAMQIKATVDSITNAATSARVHGDDDVFAAGAATSSRSTTSASSGSLLGGVGGAVNSTAATLGSTVNATTNAVGTTTNGLGNSLGTIQISQSSNTSVQGESVLSLQGGNLRLEKGAKFNLVVTQSVR